MSTIAVLLLLARVCHGLTIYEGFKKVVIPDIVPDWMTSCFTSGVYTGNLCTPVSPISKGLLYVACPYNICSRETISTVSTFARETNMTGIIFRGHFPSSHTCEWNVPGTFVQYDLSLYAAFQYRADIYLEHDYRPKTLTILYSYQFGLCVIVSMFIFSMVCNMMRVCFVESFRVTIRPLPLDVHGASCQRVITHTTYNDDTSCPSCPICIEPFERGDSISTLGCGHAFKSPCIKEWLEKDNRCPMCNATS